MMKQKRAADSSPLNGMIGSCIKKAKSILLYHQDR